MERALTYKKQGSIIALEFAPLQLYKSYPYVRYSIMNIHGIPFQSSEEII